MTEQEIRSLMYQDREKGNRALFDTYYHYVYAIVFRKVNGTGSREDVEECVIDVFTEVMRNFSCIENGSLKAYLGTAARNKAINMCRYLSAKSRQTISIDSEDFSELPSEQNIETSIEQSEQTQKLLDCIHSLGEPDSVIIIQKYFLDRNSIEIARILNMNPITVRSRAFRAVKRLKQILSDAGITL